MRSIKQKIVTNTIANTVGHFVNILIGFTIYPFILKHVGVEAVGIMVLIDSVGGAIITGCKWARDNYYDAAVIMAGDGEMDPDDLPAILDPVVDGEVDYSKEQQVIYR